MRGKSLHWMLVFGVAELCAASPAWGDDAGDGGVNWSGPGWYVQAPSPPFGLTLGAGPYGDQGTCESEKAKISYAAANRNLTGLMFCGYLDSDPNK